MKQPALGKKIFDLRKQKGLTQEELVEKCNISVRTIQRIEAGETTPRSFTVKTILEALEADFNIDEFLSSRILRVLGMLQLDHPLSVKLEPNTAHTTKSYFVANVNQQGKTQASQIRELNPALHPIFISQHELNRPFKGYKITYSTENFSLSSTKCKNVSAKRAKFHKAILG